MSTQDGSKQGAGKHLREFFAEYDTINERFLADGVVKPIIGLREMMGGAGGATIWILEQDKLEAFLFDPQLLAFRAKAEMIMENLQLKLFTVTGEMDRT